MKVSLNTIKQFVDIDMPIDQLVQKINMQLGGVEEVTNLTPKYKDVVIVKVLECEKHPNADKLSVCMIDDGGAVTDVERDERGLVRVVCGAPNARAGIFAAWLPPKSTVPATYDDAEPFILDARELRGIKSNGMLAAADELALGNDHAGIIEINPNEWKPSKTEIKPGASFAEAYGLNDTIIDIENKMFTHRPDLFGQIGVAREIAGITGKKFVSPDWYKSIPAFTEASRLELTVFNEAKDKVPRFTAVAIKGVAVRPSPLWLQIELVRLGSKAINNIVDATNYVMLLTAQPTHAYDYDKLKGHTLGARMARDGEKAYLLNDKTYELTKEDIVIVDGEGVVGLGGIMGGGTSEVSAETKNIVLECADFDMYTVRKSSMRYGLFTDALTRFNKGQSPLQQTRVLSLLMQSVFDVAGGSQASAVFDLMNDSVERMIEADETSPPLSIKPQFIRDRLGVNLPKYDMVQLLGNVEFPLCEDCGWNPEDTKDNDDDLHVNIPFWRTDIQLPEDVVEEIGRLYGFDKLPRELPKRSIVPAAKNPVFELKKRVREALSRAGANEVLTYSFVHENTLKKAEQDITQAFQLSNALSPDLQYYRLSVLPSLLEKVHPNIKAGHDEFVLFEIGKGHNKKYHADDDDGLPSELEFVDAVYASKKPHDGAAYYHMQKVLTTLAHELGFKLVFKPIKEELDFPVTAPFDQNRSALVESESGQFIGMIGELKETVIRSFKLPDYTAAMTLDLDGLLAASSAAGNAYQPLSRFPKVTQDISLKVSADTQYQHVFRVVSETVRAEQPGACDVSIEPLSIYQSKDDADHKTITLRLTIASYEKTLTDKDVTLLLDAVAEKAQNLCGAERI